MQYTVLSKRIVMAVAIIVVLSLAACGTAATGGGGVLSTQTSPADQAVPTSVPTSDEAINSDPPSVGQGGVVQDQDSLIDALRKAGATVEPKGELEQSFLSVTGTQLVVNGAEVQVFEYTDEAAAQADAANLSDVLAGKGTTMVTWVASPHAYRAGRAIALYLGDDATVLKVLQETMGEPFAEQQLPSLVRPTADPAAPTSITSRGADKATDLLGLVDRLTAQGLKVEPAGEVEQPFFDVKGTALKVGEADVQVFEFADEEAAQDALTTIGPDGHPATMIVEWVGSPHFYQSGPLVVLYVGDDAAITKALTDALGEQVAGQ